MSVETDVLKIDEAASYLRVSVKTVRKLASVNSKFPCRIVDKKGTLRFSRAALAAWVAGGAR